MFILEYFRICVSRRITLTERAAREGRVRWAAAAFRVRNPIQCTTFMFCTVSYSEHSEQAL